MSVYDVEFQIRGDLKCLFNSRGINFFNKFLSGIFNFCIVYSLRFKSDYKKGKKLQLVYIDNNWIYSNKYM